MDHSRVVLLLWTLFVVYVSRCPYYTVLSVPCSLVITCWERAELFGSLVYDVSLCFVTFPYHDSGKMLYLIV